MTIRFERLKGLSSRAGRFLLAGTLAAALTPAVALAAPADLQQAGSPALAQGKTASLQHYDPVESDLAIIGESGDPLAGGVELVSSEGNVHKYKGYVHSDGSHFKAYSLYTEITTDDNGVLTAVDITSGNDTFAGKWGYDTSTVEGWLPKGVSFSATQNGDGSWTPALSGKVLADYVYKFASVALMSVNAQGTADVLGIDQNFDNSRQVQSGKKQARCASSAQDEREMAFAQGQ